MYYTKECGNNVSYKGYISSSLFTSSNIKNNNCKDLCDIRNGMFVGEFFNMEKLAEHLQAPSLYSTSKKIRKPCFIVIALSSLFGLF
jgi:hypothetical protein